MISLFSRLYKALPYTVINTLPIFNVSGVYDLTFTNPYCNTLRTSGTIFECTCAFVTGPMGDLERQKMDVLAVEYNHRLKLARDKFMQPLLQHARNTSTPLTFAVMMDPILTNVHIPDWSLDMLSTVDCFHPSLRTHELMAIGVWYAIYYIINSYQFKK